MKTLIKTFFCVIALALFTNSLTAQKSDMKINSLEDMVNNHNLSEDGLNVYVIERNIPDAGKLTPEQLKGISQKSCSVIEGLGPDIVWLHSYVVENQIFCVYKAKNKELLAEHARQGGFPADNITMVSTVINPDTAR